MHDRDRREYGTRVPPQCSELQTTFETLQYASSVRKLLDRLPQCKLKESLSTSLDNVLGGQMTSPQEISLLQDELTQLKSEHDSLKKLFRRYEEIVDAINTTLPELLESFDPNIPESYGQPSSSYQWRCRIRDTILSPGTKLKYIGVGIAISCLLGYFIMRSLP